MISRMTVSTVDVRQDEPRTLPYQEPLRTWAGRGTGVLCDLCGVSINAQEIEYEVELQEPAGNTRDLHFHVNCYRAWEIQG